MTLHERAIDVTPGGAQTRSKRATAFPPGFPQFLTRGQGAHVWDVDGRRYVDWMCALATISLGYGHPDVQHAVHEQVDRGVSFSLPTTLEIVVAEELRAMLPAADMVRFVKTGSEATEGAMRMARLATGRDLIISIGYHGWHSAHDAALSTSPGVPAALKTVIGDGAWGSMAPFEYVEENHLRVAAVLLEACRDEPPPTGYLRAVRNFCNRTGALLILDEVVTGFRWAVGGAGEFFGILPDLATFGKGMANGYPLAAIVGRQDIMQHATYVSGTFGGECVSLAACQATLKVFREEPVIKHLWNTGARLMAGFNDLAKSYELTMRGYPVHPRIVGARRDEFIAAAAREGVLFHPAGFNVSYAHGVAELDETLEACRRALKGLP